MLPTKFRFIWPSGFRGEDFLETSQSETRIACGQWWPCLLTDRDEMSILYRGPAIDASYQVSVHLVKWFQRRRFLKNRPIRKKNCLWWPCLLMVQEHSLERTFHRCFLPSFTSFGWGVSEEKIQVWKVNGRQTTYDGPWTPSDGKSSHFLWQGELKSKNMQQYKCLIKTDSKKQKFSLFIPVSDFHFQYGVFSRSWVL